jgi:uncharacterized protein
MPDIDALDWKNITAEMHNKGYAVVPRFLSARQCRALIDLYDRPDGYRKKVVMERYRFGRGEYKYWDYPLPDMVQHLRENLYPCLAPIANVWMQALRIDKQFPVTLRELQTQCHAAGQLKPTSLILKYGKGGFNTLHQDLYGEVYFPIQTACFLSQPGQDYEGGEFVLTQQTPRAQSKAIVLKPQQGDMIIFTTKFRPAKGARGYYRVNTKHGVSEVHSGERYTLGVIFHDAVS